VGESAKRCVSYLLVDSIADLDYTELVKEFVGSASGLPEMEHRQARAEPAPARPRNARHAGATGAWGRGVASFAPR
jgi:hypothetical protein